MPEIAIPSEIIDIFIRSTCIVISILLIIGGVLNIPEYLNILLFARMRCFVSIFGWVFYRVLCVILGMAMLGACIYTIIY